MCSFALCATDGDDALFCRHQEKEETEKGRERKMSIRLKKKDKDKDKEKEKDGKEEEKKERRGTLTRRKTEENLEKNVVQQRSLSTMLSPEVRRPALPLTPFCNAHSRDCHRDQEVAKYKEMMIKKYIRVSSSLEVVRPNQSGPPR